MNILVQNVKNERVDYDRITSIGNNEDIAIKNNRTLTVDAEQHLKTTGKHSELRESDASLEIKGDFAQKVIGNLGIKVNQHIVLESDTQVTLKVGGSFIVIHQSGIHIQSPVVTINSGGTPADVVSPTNPKVLDTAAGSGKAFVFHCPFADKPEEEINITDRIRYEAIVENNPKEGYHLSSKNEDNALNKESALNDLSGMVNNANNLFNTAHNIVNTAANNLNIPGADKLNQSLNILSQGSEIVASVKQAANNPKLLADVLGIN